MLTTFRRHVAPRSRGQSLAEFAIALPVLLLLLLVGLDFGRVYLGWINLQNMARIAANYASNNPTAWSRPDDAIKQRIRATYAQQVRNDATASNCKLPVDANGVSVIPDPTFPSGTGIGASANVAITCTFGVITPVISNVIGSQVAVSAASVFPIRTGLTSPGNAPSAPNAAFTVSTTTPMVGQLVTFTDQSTGSPTFWSWDFDGNGSTDSITQSPTFAYNTAGTFQACLIVANSGGTDPTPACVSIVVTSPGTVDFVGSPLGGSGSVMVQFTDQSSPGGTAFAWDFTNDGIDDQVGSQTTASHTYTTGTYSVRLTVTFPSGSVSTVKTAYITVGARACTVPDFSDTSTGTNGTTTQSTWTQAGFTTTVAFKQGGLPWTILSQTITGGQSVLCSSTIRVSRTSTP